MPNKPPLEELARSPGAPPLDSDAILDRFLGYVADQGLSLYTAQEEAILELVAERHVILNTPTGSGKSLVAAALHDGSKYLFIHPVRGPLAAAVIIAGTYIVPNVI